MSKFSEGMQVGNAIVQQGVDSFDRARSYRDKIAKEATEVAAQKEQLAYERNKDAGLSDAELGDYRKTGVLPSRVGAKSQVSGLVGQEKIDAAAAKAAADAKKGHTEITADMIEKNPAYKKAGLVPGIYPDSYINQQTKPASGASAAMEPNAKESFAADLASGKLKGKNMTEVMGRASPKDRGEIYIRAKELNPNLSISDSDVEYLAGVAGAKATATSAAGIKVNLDSAHSGFKEVMTKAKNIASKMKQGDLAAFNKAYQYGKRSFNSPDAIELAAQLDLAAGGYARIKKGGTGSLGEGDEASAAKILSNELNRGGLEAIERAAETEYTGRIKGLPGSKNIDAAAAYSNYSDPVKAKQISEDYKSGPKTKALYEKAQKDLDALRNK